MSKANTIRGTDQKPHYARAKAACAHYQVARSTLWQWTKSRHDFPQPLKAGENHAVRHQRHRRFSQSAGSEVRGQAIEKNKATSPEKKAALEAIRAEFKGASSDTECARLLEALARFPVTTLEAMRFLDVYHCPARILQLRKAGHRILTHRQPDRRGVSRNTIYCRHSKPQIQAWAKRLEGRFDGL